MSHVSIISAGAAATDRTGFPCHARVASIMQGRQAGVMSGRQAKKSPDLQQVGQGKG